MLYAIVLGIHVVVCVLLIMVVLLQSAKGGGLAGGSAFGGGAEATMFGSRGAATMLSKATTWFGGAFMVTSLALTLLGAGRTAPRGSVIAEEAAKSPLGVPATQTAPPTALPDFSAPVEGTPVPAPAGDGAAAPPAETPAPVAGDPVPSPPSDDAPGGE